ncbi:hypothetical protein GO988_17380 [Hymenobacter sp. HMF4947]|uniref:Uncharacterized protein n=1 Tax=Hymenobacter ginkgonis TaxID=2682976 RepID=A0A7K1TI68_9BACT|nr:hypothetical protein [Hymenobacter ginkgonis]MVN78104.1 hypothetical protein [Hymenobacter ginkgonis]
MQPHPPQLPMNDVATTAGPRNWKRGALLLFCVVAGIAALIAFMLPKKRVEGRNAPQPTEHRSTSPGFNNPTR